MKLPARASSQAGLPFTDLAITQIRRDTAGPAYYLRKRASGKSHSEAMRCLKRRLPDTVYRQPLNDANATT